MDNSNYIKQEPNEPTCVYNPSQSTVGSAFETYINSDFVEDNSVSPGAANNNTAPSMNFDLDVSNSEMMCYFMDSDMLPNDLAINNNLSIDRILESNNLVYLNSHLLHSYPQSSYSAPSRKNDAPKKKSNSTRKSSPKSTVSEPSAENSSAFRPDLILSPDELDLIAKANPKERRQIRNKISARNFRLRRKEYVTDLELKASRFDEEFSLLQEALLKNENENVHLKNCLDDLLKKFNLLTSSFSGLQQFNGLDPLNDITITVDGKLTSSKSNIVSPGNHQDSSLSCREQSSLEGNIKNENLSDGAHSSIFPNSRDHGFMVKA